jgi:hypothetical protein
VPGASPLQIPFSLSGHGRRVQPQQREPLHVAPAAEVSAGRCGQRARHAFACVASESVRSPRPAGSVLRGRQDRAALATLLPMMRSSSNMRTQRSTTTRPRAAALARRRSTWRSPWASRVSESSWSAQAPSRSRPSAASSRCRRPTARARSNRVVSVGSGCLPCALPCRIVRLLTSSVSLCRRASGCQWT